MFGKGARIIVAALASTVAVCCLAGTAAADTRAIPSGGTTTIRSAPFGVDGLQQPELRAPRVHQGEAGEVNRDRPGFKNGKFPKNPLDAPTVPSAGVAGSSPELNLSFLGSEPPRPAARQRRQPVLARAARPGAVRRRRVHARGDQQRAARLQLRHRCSLDRCPGPEHVLRVPGGDQPDHGRIRGPGDRSGLPLRPRQQPFRRRDHDSSLVAGRHLHRPQHHRSRRLQHRQSDGCLDHLLRAGAERRNRGHTEPRLHPRRDRSRALFPGLPARRRRSLGPLRHDQRVRPVRAELTTRRRSTPSRRRSSPPTRPRST